MSDNTSVIDAIKLIAKATKEDSDKMSDMAKGALHADQIALESPGWHRGTRGRCNCTLPPPLS